MEARATPCNFEQSIRCWPPVRLLFVSSTDFPKGGIIILAGRIRIMPQFRVKTHRGEVSTMEHRIDPLSGHVIFHSWIALRCDRKRGTTGQPRPLVSPSGMGCPGGALVALNVDQAAGSP